MDNPEKLDTVTEVHIKGWKIEKSIMEILHLSLQHIDRLNTIRYKMIKFNQTKKINSLFYFKSLELWT